MPAARPLRDVFTDLLGQGGGISDPDEALRASGHADLPDGLVAEAVVNFAETAPIEVAEHLAPYVAANSPMPQVDDGAVNEPVSWLEALTSAPVVTPTDPGADLDAADLPAPLDQTGLDQGNSSPDLHGVEGGLSEFGIGDLGHDPTDGLDAATGSDAGVGTTEPATPELPPLDVPPLDVPPLDVPPFDDESLPAERPDEPFEG